MPTILTDRFRDAVEYAAIAHGGQVRKGTDITYVSHLLAVASLVLEAGGDEDTAIAGLLHDTAEDAGGRERLADLRNRFGDRVADTVAACSDTFEDPKPPWVERKQRYLDHIGEKSPAALLVTWADKLHNARSIVADHRQHGDDLWDRFSGGPVGSAWYYANVLHQLEKAGLETRLLDELRPVVEDLCRRAGTELADLRGLPAPPV